MSRFDEQLQQLLAEDSEILQDSLSLPLCLPETLVPRPQIICPLTKIPVPRSPEVKPERNSTVFSIKNRDECPGVVSLYITGYSAKLVNAQKRQSPLLNCYDSIGPLKYCDGIVPLINIDRKILK